MSSIWCFAFAYFVDILPGELHLKLVQAGLVVRGWLRSRTKSFPLPPTPPSPPSPRSTCTPDAHRGIHVPIKALDPPFPGSLMIVGDPLLRYLRAYLSGICCGDIFWSVPALSGTVSPLSGVWAGIVKARLDRWTGGSVQRAPGQAATKP